MVVYGLGSLYTSLLPQLIPSGVAHSVGGVKEKILLLNKCNDRETEGYTALDFIYAIVDALNYSYNSVECGVEDLIIDLTKHELLPHPPK